MSYPWKKLNTLAKILKIIEKWMCVEKEKWTCYGQQNYIRQ
jgi:hypothetical protein